MSSIQRYKKPGGFNQLLSLIETFGGQKREKFIEMVEAESAAWAKALREKMLSIERIFSWPDQVVVEVFKNLPMKNMAVVLEGIKPEQKARMLVFFTAIEKRRLEDELHEKPKPEEVTANLVKLVEFARKMIHEGDLRPEKFDEGLLIPEDIESRLEAQAGQELVDKIHDDPGSALVFNIKDGVAKPSTHPAGEAVGGAGVSQHDLQQLQRTLAALAAENKKLKDEVRVLRDKLEQIRKIA